MADDLALDRQEGDNFSAFFALADPFLCIFFTAVVPTTPTQTRLPCRDTVAARDRRRRGLEPLEAAAAAPEARHFAVRPLWSLGAATAAGR